MKTTLTIFIVTLVFMFLTGCAALNIQGEEDQKEAVQSAFIIFLLGFAK